MSKWDQKAANKKAQSLYKEVKKESFDIKALVSDVNYAVQAKKAQQAQKAKSAQGGKTDGAQPQIKKAQEAIEELKKRTEAVAKSKSVEDEMLDALWAQQKEANEAIHALWKLSNKYPEVVVIAETLDKELDVLTGLGDKLRDANLVDAGFEDLSEELKGLYKAGANQKALPPAEKPEDLKDKGTSKQNIDSAIKKLEASKKEASSALRDESGVFSLRKSVRLALGAIGSSIRDRTIMGSAAKSAMGTANARSVETLISKFEDTPILVKSIKTVDRGLRVIGSAIKGTGTETLKWISKHLSSLALSLRRFMRLPTFGGRGFGLQDMLGLAVLGPSLIKPLLDDIDKALTDRYGEHYIQKFFSDVWANAKDFITDKMKEFVTMLVKPVSDAIPDSVKKNFERGQANPQGYLPPGTDGTVKPGTSERKLSRQMAASKAMDLLMFANAYASSSDPKEKAIAKAEVDKLLADGNFEVPAATKARLEELGFDTTKLTTIKPGSVTSPGQKVPPPKKGAVTGKPISVAPTQGAVSAAPVESAPMDGPPVSAKPQSVPTAARESTQIGATQSGAGITVGSIPKNASPESLYAFNIGVLEA